MTNKFFFILILTLHVPFLVSTLAQDSVETKKDLPILVRIDLIRNQKIAENYNLRTKLKQADRDIDSLKRILKKNKIILKKTKKKGKIVKTNTQMPLERGVHIGIDTFYPPDIVSDSVIMEMPKIEIRKQTKAGKLIRKIFKKKK